MNPLSLLIMLFFLCCSQLVNGQQSDTILSKQILINNLKSVLQQDKDFLEAATAEREHQEKMAYNYFNLTMSARDYIVANRGKMITREDKINMYEKAGVAHPAEYYDELQKLDRLNRLIRERYKEQLKFLNGAEKADMFRELYGTINYDMKKIKHAIEQSKN